MANDSAARSATIFHLLRHAPTEWNAAGRIQGHSDSPLTGTGRAWARRWGALLAPFKPQRLLTSDLGRAVATGQALNAFLKLPATAEARLRELDWGRWTGSVHRRLKTNAARRYAREQAQGWDFRPPQGESHLDLLERALAALIDAAAAYPGQTILVVTHEGVIKCLVYHLAIRDGCGRRPTPLKPWHTHHLRCGGGQVVLQRVNALNLNG